MNGRRWVYGGVALCAAIGCGGSRSGGGGAPWAGSTHTRDAGASGAGAAAAGATGMTAGGPVGGGGSGVTQGTAAASATGGAGSTGAGADPNTLPHTTTDTFLADADDGFATLALGSWELAKGQETYTCLRVTVPEDIYVSAFKSVSPLGTHHATVGLAGPTAGPDGVFEDCGPNISDRQIFASGASEVSETLPEGVAMRLAAGVQVDLRLHLFNTSEDPLRGQSGVLVRLLPKAEVVHEAGAVLAGPVTLSIPPGRVVQSGSCSIGVDATIFDVFPHMHTLGVSMKITAERAQGGDAVLFEGPYDFNEQNHYAIDPVEVHAGDRVVVECTYENTTGALVSFGESTLDEMCFAGLSSYPPISNQTLCFN